MLSTQDESKRLADSDTRIIHFIRYSFSSLIVLVITNISVLILCNNLRDILLYSTILWFLNIVISFVSIAAYLDQCYQNYIKFHWRTHFLLCSILCIYYWPVFAVRYCLPKYWADFEKAPEVNVLLERINIIEKELAQLADTQETRIAKALLLSSKEEVYKFEEIKKQQISNMIAINYISELNAISDTAFVNFEAWQQLLMHTKELNGTVE